MFDRLFILGYYKFCRYRILWGYIGYSVDMKYSERCIIYTAAQGAGHREIVCINDIQLEYAYT